MLQLSKYSQMFCVNFFFKHCREHKGLDYWSWCHMLQHSAQLADHYPCHQVIIC